MAGETLSDLADEFLIECPRCGAGARVAAGGPGGEVRLTCPACGLIREKDSGSRLLGEPVDGYFGVPLLLRTRCCGEGLWAYNARHLAALEEIIAAMTDRRAPRREDGLRNRLLASRLPRWMLLKGNRDDVLAGLARLRGVLASRGP